MQGSTLVNDSLLVLPGPILFTTAAGTSQSDIGTDLLETVLKSKLKPFLPLCQDHDFTSEAGHGTYSNFRKKNTHKSQISVKQPISREILRKLFRPSNQKFEKPFGLRMAPKNLLWETIALKNISRFYCRQRS